MTPLLCLLAIPTIAAASAPRQVHIQGQRFVLTATNDTIVLAGPNVVVKGPPYLPFVNGSTICDDGKYKTCTTFNQADVDHIKAMGWNTIRLGVIWAGAQPRDEDALDPTFLQSLHALLNLTDRNELNVILDNHGDMVGSAGCGNGVPMWFQKKAAGDLIGKPLETDFPYSVVSSLRVTGLPGYSHCGNNATKWAAHAGDPNYNLLNECCQSLNVKGNGNYDNPQQLGFTSISQKTMNYLIQDGDGRKDFVRFWTLIANAVKEHPSAIAAELMNEPMTIWRMHAFETWREAAVAINAIIPDMSVALADTGESAEIPSWITSIGARFVDIDSRTVEWIKGSKNLFYAWHWYGWPSDFKKAVANVKAISVMWNVPSFATEFMDCSLWDYLESEGISHSYWHYSQYCNTGPDFGNLSVPDSTFGACILGYGSGDSSRCSRQSKSIVVV